MLAPGKADAGTEAEELVWIWGGIDVGECRGYVVEVAAEPEEGSADPISVAKDAVVAIGVGGNDGDGEGGVVIHNLASSVSGFHTMAYIPMCFRGYHFCDCMSKCGVRTNVEDRD